MSGTRKIWKYTIILGEGAKPIPHDQSTTRVLQPGENRIRIPMPPYATPLSVAGDGASRIYVYYAVSDVPESRFEPRDIFIFGTGQHIDPRAVGKIIGTVFLPYRGEPSAYHIFDWAN